MLERAISSVLSATPTRAARPLVLLTTLANGAAEEVFFRGALYAAIGEQHPVALSTAVYTLATIATRNPALVLAAGVMGTLLGAQRRASGGIQAPVLTHLDLVDADAALPAAAVRLAGSPAAAATAPAARVPAVRQG